MAKATAQGAPFIVRLVDASGNVKELECTTAFQASDSAAEAIRTSHGGEKVEIVNNSTERQRVWGTP